MEIKDHISLIHKSLTGQISDSENEIFSRWLAERPENKNEYDAIGLILNTQIEEDLYINEQQFLFYRQKIENSLSKLIKQEKAIGLITASARVVEYVVFAVLLIAICFFLVSPLAISLSSATSKTLTLNGQDVIINSSPPWNVSRRSRQLAFRATTLKEMIAEIEEHYEIRCTLPVNIAECRFSGTFINTPVNEVFDVLSNSMNIHIDEVEKDRYSISGRGCPP